VKTVVETVTETIVTETIVTETIVTETIVTETIVTETIVTETIVMETIVMETAAMKPAAISQGWRAPKGKQRREREDAAAHGKQGTAHDCLLRRKSEWEENRIPRFCFCRHQMIVMSRRAGAGGRLCPETRLFSVPTPRGPRG
jgi:hypothetical protein